MKKITTILAVILLLAVSMTAQNPKLSYSAVVRNSANELVANENITVAVAIANDASGTAVYAETHNVTTNANGMVSLTIGEGTGATGSLADVTWKTAYITATYTLPGGATVVNTVPVSAVPYALYADNVSAEAVGGAVADYLATHGGGSYTETDPTVPAWAKAATKPAYDYSEITGTPTIPTVNDGTLTIQKNGETVGTFTANQPGTSTVNITITAQDIITAVNSMTNEEKAALCSALNCSGGGEEPTTFTCGTSKMVDADGNEYETVLIGTQCWTKTNLRVAPAGATDMTSSGTSSTTEPYYYVNSSVDAATYGYYYNWEAAKLACPSGWHLPSDAEWTAMEATQTSMDVTGSGWRGDHAGKLAGDGWNSSSTAGAPGNATDANHNASGFSAVPAGFWFYGFLYAGTDADFWSSTEGGTSGAWRRTLYYYGADVDRDADSRDAGFSVRCLRDETGGGTTYVQPTVTTSAATDITATSATLNGNVSNPDNVTITAQGFEWKTTTGGTYAVVNATGEPMTYSLTGLAAGTSYTYRAFVTTAEGTSYGSEVDFTTTAGTIDPTSFTCGTSKMVDADGNEYETVLIGTQCWTKTNLRVAPVGATDATSSGANSNTVPYYYVNPSVDAATYGYYYNWEAAKLACPAGWHLPNDAEWNTLEATVSGSDWQESYATATGYRGSHAGKLAGDGWNSSTTAGAPGNVTDANHNASGFSAVSAGNWGYGFNDAGGFAYFWSSTENGTFYAWYRNLYYSGVDVHRSSYYRNNGFSVRCLRDETGGGTTYVQPTVTTSSATNITSTSATMNGNVSNPDNVTITAQGFEWKTTTGGTYAVVNATGEPMTYSLTGLAAGTSYTYRAFVTTAEGTSYGSEVEFTTTAATTFTCGTSKMEDADGNEYETVLIGTQCWTKTNLRVAPAGATDGTSSGAYSYTVPYYYVKPGVDAATYGYYYNWEAAKLACPAGWHLPSDAEWNTLEATVSGSDWQESYATATGYRGSHAGKLAGDGWNSSTTAGAPGNVTDANHNASGFSAVPAGNWNDGFDYAGYFAFFWSSTVYGAFDAWSRGLGYNNADVYRRNYGGRYGGFSVRCLRDETGGGTTYVQPTVTTSSATNITSTSATMNGNVSNPDNVTITAQGFEWKTTTGGTYAVVNATGEPMTYSLTGLAAGTSYTYRAFVTTAEGTSYGSEVEFTTTAATTFTCGTSKMEDADGNEYETVLIGTQCWTKTNLRVAPVGATDATSSGANSNTVPYYYVNPSVDAATYGYYYNWEAAKLACPAGWHLPNDAEWNTLEATVSGSDWQESYATATGYRGSHAGKLAGDGWNSSTTAGAPGNVTDANHNASGFSAVPAGDWSNGFYNAGNGAFFWSSTERGTNFAWYRSLNYRNADVSRDYNGRNLGYSVRCLRD